MKRTSPLITGAAILISALVLLLCVAGIIGIWVLNSSASSAIMGLLGGLDKASQAARASIAATAAELTSLDNLMGGVEQSVTQAGQNIDNRQVVQSLLPEAQDQAITDSAQRVQKSILNLSNFITGVRDMYRAVDRLPFISMPRFDSTRVQMAAQEADKLIVAIGDLDTRLGELRTGAATSPDQAAKAIIVANTAFYDIQNNVIQTDAQFAKLQIGLDQAKSTIPTIFILFSILLSLFLIWVGISQVVVIRRAWSILQQPLYTQYDEDDDLLMGAPALTGGASQAGENLPTDAEDHVEPAGDG